MKRFSSLVITFAMLLSLVVTSFCSVSVGAVELPDGNGKKVVYIPLDDRPVNLDRVIFLAEAAGLELLLPASDHYVTVLDPDYKGLSDQGNPEELFEWLKSVADEADYFVISLDQLFSGGLVGSRAPFGDLDDRITNEIGEDGKYYLSDKEQEIIDYLIQLSNRDNTHVVYFDTVMRLASTVNFFDYRGNDYENFRSYGIIEREQFSGDALNIDNIVANYNYNKNHQAIAVELTEANKGNYNISYGETSVGSMVFTDETYGATRGLDATEYKEYFAARERKLRIADALYPNVAETVDRLYIGVDDSNPKVTIQTNECNYITEKLIKGYDQCALFAGADELGLMGIADVATHIYGNVGVNLQYFGNGKDQPADEFDKGTLDETVKTHIAAVGADYNSANPEMDILVLTRTDNGNGYNSTELTELNNQISALVAKALDNQSKGIPTCIVDTSWRKSLLAQAILDSGLDIGRLMGYSEWNTVSNALGIGISNAVARYAYLSGVVVSNTESQGYYDYSHVGFLKVTAHSWAKDYAYHQKSAKPYPSESDFDTQFNVFYQYAKIVADKINQGSIYVGRTKSGVMLSENLYDVSILNLRWPWDRAFEATFDIGVYENGEALPTGKTISNLALNKPYTTSPLYQQGGADVSWGWSDSAPVTYPDEGGITLTDGAIASSTAKYKDVEWAAFHPKSPDYITNGYSSITIDLGEVKDVYRASVYVGTSYLTSGIYTPKLLELYVSNDGVNFEKVGETAPSDDSSKACSAINIYSKYEYATARYVQIRISSGNYMFVCEAQVYGCETTPDSAVSDPIMPTPTMESIVIDGYYNDLGWAADGWKYVSPENGYWQDLPTTSNTISYRYQLRTDDTKLYVAVQVDVDLIVGGNGSGTNLRFWINTDDSSTYYTHFYDVNGLGTAAKYNTSTTSNVGENIENSSINGIVTSNNGKSNFEFSVDLAEFNGENGFNYYIAVSNYKDGQNLCLYFPPVIEGTSRSSNLPYNNWYFENQGVCDVEAVKLGVVANTSAPRLEFESYTVDTSNAYVYWDTNAPNRFKDDGIRLINGVKSTFDGWSAEYSAWKMNQGDVLDVEMKLLATSYVEKVVAYFAGECAGVSQPASITVAYSADGINYTSVEAACKIEKVYTTTNSNEFSRYVYTVELPEPTFASHIKTSIHMQTWGSGMMWVDEIEAYGEIHVHEDADGQWTTDENGHSRTCSCGVVFDQGDHIGGEATCTEKAICSVCNTAYGDIDENNHAGETYLVNEKEATCTEDGYTGDEYCSDCVAPLAAGEVIPKNGHAYGEWYEVEAPTCTETGLEQRDCANCDHYETNELPENGHDYEAVVTEPTCTEQGYTTYTCHCGDSYVSDYVDANGHDYEAAVTAPTCTEQGYTTYTCHCGDSYVSDYVDANGHAYGEWYEVEAATADENGIERRDCANCDHYETQEIPALGHNYQPTVTEPTCTEQGYTTYYCDCCGNSYKTDYVDATGHDHEAVVTEPTCTEQGYTTYTCHCGDSYVDDYVAANGHAYGEWYEVEAPTCTETGLEQRDCKNCDHYETNVLPENGHDYKAVVTAPTCTEQGYTTYTCHCGDSYVDDYVAANGHAYGDWYEVFAPTETEPGLEKRECANCDHYETNEIPSTNSQIKLGDIDKDSKINIVDYMLLKRACFGTYTLDAHQKIAADIDKDGDIDAVDYLLLKSFCFGMYVIE